MGLKEGGSEGNGDVGTFEMVGCMEGCVDGASDGACESVGVVLGAIETDGLDVTIKKADALTSAFVLLTKRGTRAMTKILKRTTSPNINRFRSRDRIASANWNSFLAFDL